MCDKTVLPSFRKRRKTTDGKASGFFRSSCFSFKDVRSTTRLPHYYPPTRQAAWIIGIEVCPMACKFFMSHSLNLSLATCNGPG